MQECSSPLWQVFVFNPTGCLATLLTRTTWWGNWFSRRWFDHAGNSIELPSTNGILWVTWHIRYFRWVKELMQKYYHRKHWKKNRLPAISRWNTGSRTTTEFKQRRSVSRRVPAWELPTCKFLCARGAMGNGPEFEIGELNSYSSLNCYIHLHVNILWKGMKPPLLAPSMG